MTLHQRQFEDQELLELTTRRPRRQVHTDDLEEDLSPGSDVSFLRRHIGDDIDDDNEAYDNTINIPKSSVWQRFLNFMSRTPLISQSGSSSYKVSYGALSSKHAKTDEDVSFLNQDSLDHVRKRDKRRPDELRSGSAWENAQYRNRAGGSGVARSKVADEDLISMPDGPIDDDEDPPDNSHYPQVRASVSAIDNAAASISTPRMWTLSLLCALLGSGTNLFFSLRYPSVAVTPVIALVVVHPLGLAWDRLFKQDDDPVEVYEYGTLLKRSVDGENLRRLTRLRRWLAQGRWNEKEHACVYISSNVSFGFAFATDVCATLS